MATLFDPILIWHIIECPYRVKMGLCEEKVKRCGDGQESRIWHQQATLLIKGWCLIYGIRGCNQGLPLQRPVSFLHANKTPVQTIASNAGVEGAVIVGKLLGQEDTDLGYDAAKGEYVDMVKDGIIDPLKVSRTALVDAASVSPLMTTTESIIVEIPKEESRAVQPMHGVEY